MLKFSGAKQFLFNITTFPGFPAVEKLHSEHTVTIDKYYNNPGVLEDVICSSDV